MAVSPSDMGGKPELAVNRDGHTVAEALDQFITNATTGYTDGAQVDIATAYFNLGGYGLLAESLAQATKVRLLLGAEPDPPEALRRSLSTESSNPQKAARRRLERSLSKQERTLASERDLLGFTIEVDHRSQQLVEWLRSGQVEVRRLESRFLHGKAFLVGTRDHGVVAGSSNFTRAGLTTNMELNLGNYSTHVVKQVQGWFNELWEEASPYDLAALFEDRFEPHSPQLIYLRMLWERYGAELLEEADATGASRIHLTTFQKDGVWRAKRIMERHNGVLVADEVGLGKTYVAGKLIEEAAIDRRQRVLVVAPATLRDGPWKAFQAEKNLPMEVVSFDDLAADDRLNLERGTGPKLSSGINDYAMVVVDEAHNLRNPSTQRAEALRQLLAGTPPKKLVLLTATPVNNSLWDLYYVLGYFLKNDGEFADVGIGSLRSHFATAMAQDPNDLSPQHLFDVLDAVAVRRTRSFVKKHYANDTVPINGKDQTIEFPTPKVRKVSYDLDGVLPGFFDRLAHALDPDHEPSNSDSVSTPQVTDNQGVFTLARYAPSLYRIDRNVESRQTQLAGLLRSGLLKRFESSPHAFANTCETMANSCDAFLALLTHGQVATGDDLADWIATDSDDIDEIDKYLDEHVGLTEDASDYRIEDLSAAVHEDANLLRDFAAQARTVTRDSDPNLAALADALADINDQAQRDGIGDDDVGNRRKVLVFSYYADTVDWIYDYLTEAVKSDDRLSPYRDRVVQLTGSGGDKTSVLWGFAPDTTDAPEGSDHNLYDILVTTDVLAEGVNLQQAGNIINYDLPWNPMRLVQRHGRIDRIRSPHKEVYIRCVFPDRRLDDLLGLEERLQLKITQAAASVGVGDVLPDQAADAVDRNFTENREQIAQIQAGESALFVKGGTAISAQSGEEYRQELRQALENPNQEQRIKQLAGGSGSGFASESVKAGHRGFVFCLRVGDWEQPLFRYKELAIDNPVGSSESTDTLSCLSRAQPPDHQTPRVLDDRTHQLAYTAWQMVLDDTVGGWNHFSDKANLEPRIRPILDRAADSIRSNPPSELTTQDEVDQVVDSIRAPHTERVVRTLNVALRSTDGPIEQAIEVLRVVRKLGLEPYSPPEPLPLITAEDVHLVCWQALTPVGE